MHADLERFSVHAVASAVGACIRELPEPLLTRELYMEFLRAMGEFDKHSFLFSASIWPQTMDYSQAF